MWLGIDGGGTGCRAAVADESGFILAEGVGGPANIATNPDIAISSILAAAQMAMSQVFGNRAADQMAGIPTVLSLAGANVPGAADGALAVLPFKRARIVSDAVAAVKGALGHDDGIVAAIGTGSVFARQSGGAIHQIGGWGLTLGDHGSGAWIGRAILTSSLRAAQGFTPMTPLCADLLADLDGADGIIRFSLTARTADFAALAPKVTDADDEAALLVMQQAVADVAESIAVLQGNGLVPVTFTGGLGAKYAVRLMGAWPQVAAKGNALDGALLLARAL